MPMLKVSSAAALLLLIGCDPGGQGPSTGQPPPSSAAMEGSLGLPVASALDERGLTVFLGDGAVRIGLVGPAEGPLVCADPACTVRSATKLGVEEWWREVDGGVEHGFIVPSAPAERVLDVLVEGAMVDLLPDSVGVLLRPTGTLASPLTYDGLVAWDAGHRPVPAWFELEEDRIRIRWDDTTARYPVTIDPAVTLQGTREANTASAQFGHELAGAGDVNGDGFDDVIVGAYLFSNGETAEGKAWLYLGASYGLSSTPSWSFEGAQANANLGLALGSAGDVNGDGKEDVIVGAPYFDNGQTDEGKVWVFHGTTTGLSTTANWSNESNYPTARYGHGVGGGHFSADTFDDVVVTSPNYGTTASFVGRMFVYQGSAAGLATASATTTDGNHNSSCWGCDLAVGGDANNDGRDDVLVGATLWTQNYSNEGAAFLYLGAGNGIAGVAARTWYGAAANNGMGPVGWAGDTNTDGRDDGVVGVPAFGTSDTGVAWLYLGTATGMSSAVSQTWTGTTNAQLGSTIDGGQDINGDGAPDLLIGSPLEVLAVGTAGQAAVYLGTGLAVSATASWTGFGAAGGDRYGDALAIVGDLDADGYGDIVVGAPLRDNGQSDEGGIYVYLGQEADSDGDGDADTTDCNDSNPAIYTGAYDSPGDGIDQDCDGQDDINCYDDNDGDGYGSFALIPSVDFDCTDPGESGNNQDCNDTAPAVHPGAIDTPGDGIDQDCSGADAIWCYVDTDNDGYGSSAQVASIDNDCNDLGEAPVAGDCNNNAAAINPGATEIYNDGIDQDCSGSDATQCYQDADHDGYGSSTVIVSADADCNDLGEDGAATDCNDAAVAIYPSAPEIPDNGVDEDCSGSDTVTCWNDSDGDTYGAFPIQALDGDCVDPGECTTGGDCNDTSASVYPGATEVPDDAIDQDCDGADSVTPGDDDDSTPVGDDDTEPGDDDTTPIGDDDSGDDDSAGDDDSTPAGDDDSAVGGDDDDDSSGRRGCSCETQAGRSGAGLGLLGLSLLLRRRGRVAA